MKNLILLTADMSAATMLGAVTTVMVALLGFLLRDAYSRMTERIKVLELENIALKAHVEKEMRAVDVKIFDLKSNIVDRLDEIKSRVNEARK